jgi:hypothetical protein
MLRNKLYQGWKRVLQTRHYYRNGTSLCTRSILFMDAPTLEKGKNCSECLKRVVAMRKAA